MKLVKEILYEKFSEKSDPIDDMGIGRSALSFKLHAVLFWYNTERRKQEWRKWLNHDQIVKFLKNQKCKEFNFGKGGVKIYGIDMVLHEEDGTIYESFDDILSDNMFFIKYDGEYYKIEQ